MTAVAAVTAALDRIVMRNGSIGAVTAVLEERALRTAERVDARIAAGRDPGRLAGVPFLAKNLFDVAGMVTRAGAKATQGDAPASRDADAIGLLENAGAILIGLTNMDEFAYGFVTQNQHDGPARNPHDPSRIAGGSSGGSAAGVAAGFVPFAIGTDTNGSIRVPAALCGLFGLRPTFGLLSKRGAYPLAYSLDTVGPLALTAGDLRRAFSALSPSTASGDVRCESLRITRLGGYFEGPLTPVARHAVEAVCAALDVRESADFPEAQRAREAAFLITAAEAGQLHLPRLRSRSDDYGDTVRERLIAAALVPADWYAQALRFRTWILREMHEIFERYDVLIAPATPYEAPTLEQRTVTVDGVELEKGGGLGTFTQPLALTGLPVLTVPVRRDGELPAGVQLVARWGHEHVLLALADRLS